MPTISQKSLAAILKQRKKIADAEKVLKELEEKLVTSLKAGSTVSSGVLTARLKTYERRNVAWKQVLIREKGEEFVDRVFSATRPDTYESLVVETVA